MSIHFRPLPALLALGAALLLSACSPKFDWRDYRSPDAPYYALFPGKPATHTREIDLDGVKVKMTMTATEVGSTMFAVGSAELPDPALAPAAVKAMQVAMLKNINGTLVSDKAINGNPAIQAKGSSNGTPMLLSGRFLAQDKRVYQVVVLGKEKEVVRDSVEMFLSSFKLN